MGAKLSKGTWVLIADGEKALVLENQTDHENPYLTVLSKEEQENPPDREQSANRRGRFNDGPSVHRSAVEDTDWHQLAKDRFADDLAEMLYKKAHKGAFKDIVLVAAPGVLGELRNKIHKEVEQKVIAEVPKTLTNHNLDDIEKVLKHELDTA
ncbi:Protein required for attachment to host cells [Palleronia marisminoris]|uniref:Protein required for attachment to host cells n=1 Tax=Palleronia marisminoris TaxID=315423 RepID=A0A1Y5TCF3_9RHOB|nr:host attachment family protein [Palleronia marisminoris]SFH33018.1 Protein required for attachment to host cells [Palleronia marisminoris]SLN60772.1 Protein required for attachment to host cells [Palleronia marisminoris]